LHEGVENRRSAPRCRWLVVSPAAKRLRFTRQDRTKQVIMRDGRPALVSQQKNLIVLVKPVSRQLRAGGRPVIVRAVSR
jgi:hypothetical protein